MHSLSTNEPSQHSHKMCPNNRLATVPNLKCSRLRFGSITNLLLIVLHEWVRGLIQSLLILVGHELYSTWTQSCAVHLNTTTNFFSYFLEKMHFLSILALLTKWWCIWFRAVVARSEVILLDTVWATKARLWLKNLPCNSNGRVFNSEKSIKALQYNISPTKGKMTLFPVRNLFDRFATDVEL